MDQEKDLENTGRKQYRVISMTTQNPQLLKIRRILLRLASHHGVSQKKMSKAAQVGQTSISRYMRRGGTIPRADELSRILEIVGVNLGEVIETAIIEADDKRRGGLIDSPGFVQFLQSSYAKRSRLSAAEMNCLRGMDRLGCFATAEDVMLRFGQVLDWAGFDPDAAEAELSEREANREADRQAGKASRVQLVEEGNAERGQLVKDTA